jgi:2-polyprenyl-3-methyl-5-hydroxy-6-metoxy-1,4-benzoquinol methylase
MKLKNKYQKYWSDPTDEANSPVAYSEHTERSDYLLPIIEKYVGKGDSILELGCNVGRNLNALGKAGYKKLSGVEISTKAVAECKKTYPDLEADIVNSSIEDWVKGEGEYDCIFSMAVMIHLPFESDWVFKRISDKARKVLITVEDEVNTTWKHFPRNYRDIFTGYGWEEVFSEDITGRWEGSNGYITRVFLNKANYGN